MTRIHQDTDQRAVEKSFRVDCNEDEFSIIDKTSVASVDNWFDVTAQ